MIDTITFVLVCAGCLALGILVTRKALRAASDAAYPELRITRDGNPFVFGMLVAANAGSALFLFGMAFAVTWAFFNPLKFT